MRLLVTGHRGQLGKAVVEAATSHGFAVTGVDLPEVDLTDANAVAKVVRAALPTVIVNCAAFTGVDAAEGHEAEATRINGTAVATLAALADEVGALLVQVSTDYVFDGSSPRPYREEDPPNPTSAYGRSKLAGEKAAQRARRHLIARTAWLFGHGGTNFVEAIRNQIAAGAPFLRVVNDQVGSPSYATDVAEAMVRLAAARASGIVHVVNQGAVSWFEVALEIVRQLAASVVVVPITSAESGRAARRPANSVLDTTRLRRWLGGPLPPWQDALARYLARERGVA